MSDYIYNNEISSLNSYERYFYRLNDSFGENANCAHEDVFGQSEEERNVQQMKMVGLNCLQSNEGVLMGNIDDCYEGELGRLSSSLAKLLERARKSSLQNAVVPDLAILQARTNQIPGVSESRISAQTRVTPPSDWQVERDQQRKHARNKSEKRRRSAMADSIAELGNLLPEGANRPSCRKKSTILKKSIDYIKKLKDQSVVQRIEDTMGGIKMEINTLTRRLERAELSTSIGSPEQNRIEITSEELHIKTCMTKSPVTCLKTSSSHSDPPLFESPSNVPNVSTSLSFDDVWDGFSSRHLDDEFTSLPSSFEKDYDAMDCYI